MNQASQLIALANTKLKSEVDWLIKFVILFSDPEHFFKCCFLEFSDVQDDMKIFKWV